MYFQVTLIVFLACEISGKMDIFPQVSNYIKYGENKICRIENEIYRNNLKNYSIWAYQMLDSSSKGAFGVLRGNDHQLGHYEECLNIQGPFPTQYCLVGVTINAPPRNSTEHFLDNQYETVFTKLAHYKIKNVKFGLCLPSSCSASDIQTSLTKTLNKVESPFKTGGVTYSVTAIQEFCSDYINPKIFGVLEILFCTLSVTLALLVLIGTIVDCFGKAEENPNNYYFIKKLCLSFSIQRNWNELFKAHGYQGETKIFDGIRSISVIAIFFAHFIGTLAAGPSLNGSTIDGIYNSNLRLVVEKIDLMVDIFFLMSGLLSVHCILKKWNAAYLNPIWLIFLRYIRLTPLNLYVTLYFVTMLPYFGSGPVWNLTYMVFIKDCVQNNNWWLNILYINNFMPDSIEACNFVNWYISCDFQLFIVGVLIMVILKCNLRVGCAILGFLFILSVIASFTITKVYEIGPYMGIYGSDQYKNFWNNYYTKPYTRASSYFLGMIGGILYDKLKSNEVKMSKMKSYAITGISLLAMGFSYAYLIFAYNGQENYIFEYALYNALHRPLWCLGVLGICIVASFGSIPAIRLFLSSAFWTPFAKLSYGLYLIHVIVQIATIASSTTVTRIGPLNTTRLFFAMLGISFTISSFLYVIVEAPLVQIFKLTVLRKFYSKPLIEDTAECTVMELE